MSYLVFKSNGVIRLDSKEINFDNIIDYCMKNNLEYSYDGWDIGPIGDEEHQPLYSRYWNLKPRHPIMKRFQKEQRKISLKEYFSKQFDEVKSWTPSSEPQPTYTYIIE